MEGNRCCHQKDKEELFCRAIIRAGALGQFPTILDTLMPLSWFFFMLCTQFNVEECRLEKCYRGLTIWNFSLTFQTKDFWSEAQILSKLHHPNVVAFYGVVPDGAGGTLATVTEFMVNGSLRHVLLRKDR